jgi:hypothetical protein
LLFGSAQQMKLVGTDQHLCHSLSASCDKSSRKSSIRLKFLFIFLSKSAKFVQEMLLFKFCPNAIGLWTGLKTTTVAFLCIFCSNFRLCVNLDKKICTVSDCECSKIPWALNAESALAKYSNHFLERQTCLAA